MQNIFPVPTSNAGAFHLHIFKWKLLQHSSWTNSELEILSEELQNGMAKVGIRLSLKNNAYSKYLSM